MEQLPVLILPLLLVSAAISDMTSLTIPNWISAMIVISFVGLGVASDVSFMMIGISLGTGFIILIFGMALFALGWLGGGDVKLMAASAVWFGWPAALAFLVYTVLAGGVLSLFMVGFRHIRFAGPVLSVSWVSRLHKHGSALPYGIAIAAGGLLALSQSPLLRLF